jgi:2-polyprenyl-3-methyl-5-hydroxy-6-metoxy-1,4-benzoquinol methylase
MPHRAVAPEWLDQLSPQDPQAVESRRDLRLLNFWMGNVRTIRTALAGLCRAGSPMRLAELGAGDGIFFLRVARSLGRPGPGAKVFLVDRRPSVSNRTRADLAQMGWAVEIIAADVFDWLPASEPFDAMIANLFLHHFEPDDLAALLRLMSQSSRSIVACEPRRGAPALAAGCMLRLLGCNAVTRHDAPISVRAGFRANELSAAWPVPQWKLREERAGLFSHLFVARKEA